MLPNLFTTEYERFLRRVWRERPRLSDEEFYDRFYRGSGIDPAIPSRVRAELEQALGENMGALHPSDNLVFGFEDVDFADILFRMGRVFDVRVPVQAFPAEIDGTVDSLIRCIAEKRDELK